LKSEYPSQLQARFEQAIIAGEYPAAEEVRVAQLANTWQTSPDSTRSIVQAAHRKGLVRWVDREDDRFRVVGLPSTRLASVFTHTQRAGFKPTSEVREVVVEPAGAKVADKLKVAPRSPVYRYVRTRNVDGQPLANQTNYMPFEVCPGLEHDDVTRYSFQRLLEEKYRAVVTDMKEWFSLVPATPEDGEILGLLASSSVLLIERIALSATRWPLVWAQIRIRPDRYQYVAALWPKAAELLT
jgi:GntR family transcriptional regulator